MNKLVRAAVVLIALSVMSISGYKLMEIFSEYRQGENVYIGALAGIMWMGLLKNHEVKLSFGQFIYYCAPVALAALAATLAGLTLIL